MSFFVRQLGSVRVGQDQLAVWLVIETDDDSGAAARGFLPVDPELTAEEVRVRYGVETILQVGPVVVN